MLYHYASHILSVVMHHYTQHIQEYFIIMQIIFYNIVSFYISDSIILNIMQLFFYNIASLGKSHSVILHHYANHIH